MTFAIEVDEYLDSIIGYNSQQMWLSSSTIERGYVSILRGLSRASDDAKS